MQPVYRRRMLYLGRTLKREYVVRVLTSAEVEAQHWLAPDVWREWQAVLRDDDELIAFEPAFCGRRLEGAISGVAMLRNGRTLRVEVTRYYISQQSMADGKAAAERLERRLRSRAVAQASVSLAAADPAVTGSGSDGRPQRGRRVRQSRRGAPIEQS